MTYIVYGKGGMRHLKIVWLLREMSLPHEIVPMSPRPDSPEYKRLLEMNPFGKLPVLQVDQEYIWESGAILNYLVDKHPEHSMAPRPGTIERAKHDRWFFLAHTDLEEPLWTIARHSMVFPEHLRSQEAKDAARFDWLKKVAVLETCLPESGFVTGSNFTVADIALAYVLNWGMKFDIMEKSPRAEDYLMRCLERPACPIEGT